MMHFLVNGHKYKETKILVSWYGGHYWTVCQTCYDKGKALI